MNKHIIKIKELICDDVSMGTYGMVELELLEMEKELTSNTSTNSEKPPCNMCASEQVQGYNFCSLCGREL
jgi:hypothetical protein